MKQLTKAPGYDAETTISRNGKLVFTSKRDGDLDIYTMDADGKNVKRLTNELGYDGGPFWSYDGKQIVYRAYHPQTEKEKADYVELLKQNLIRPTVLDIWVMNADGSNKRQVTHLNKASFAPYFFPDGKRIIFASNAADPKGRDFDLYKINVDGTGLERITYNDTFDGLSDVLARWQEAGVRLEPPRRKAGRHEYLYCGLGGVKPMSWLRKFTIIIFMLSLVPLAKGSTLVSPTQKFDEFGDLKCEAEMAHLDNFAIQLQQEPTARGVIIFYGGKTFQRQVTQTRRRRSASGSTEVVSSAEARHPNQPGGRNRRRICGGVARGIWVVPPGASMPTPNPSIPVGQIKFRKGRVSPRAYRCGI